MLIRGLLVDIDLHDFIAVLSSHRLILLVQAIVVLVHINHGVLLVLLDSEQVLLAFRAAGLCHGVTGCALLLFVFLFTLLIGAVLAVTGTTRIIVRLTDLHVRIDRPLIL